MTYICMHLVKYVRNQLTVGYEKNFYFGSISFICGINFYQFSCGIQLFGSIGLENDIFTC